MITDIETYFADGCGRCDRFATDGCSTRVWADGIKKLRAVCLSEGLFETVKWGHPCYMHMDRNIAIMGAFRSDFRLTFVNAGLLKDPDRVLERAGPNTAHPNVMRFKSVGDVEAHTDTLRAYLREAAAYAAQGLRAPKSPLEVEFPDELTEMLDADPELAEAFHVLTPGRKKSYAINLNGAKSRETRLRRIAGFRDRILAGKGANER